VINEQPADVGMPTEKKPQVPAGFQTLMALAADAPKIEERFQAAVAAEQMARVLGRDDLWRKANIRACLNALGAPEYAERRREDLMALKKLKDRKGKEKAARPPRTKAERPPLAERKPRTPGTPDPRIPGVGSTLHASYRGKDYTAKVVADGIEYHGKVYGTLSAAGRVITGTKTLNGFLFFGLNPKKAPAKPATAS